jgi:hypothetical protein
MKFLTRLVTVVSSVGFVVNPVSVSVVGTTCRTVYSYTSGGCNSGNTVCSGNSVSSGTPVGPGTSICSGKSVDISVFRCVVVLTCMDWGGQM